MNLLKIALTILGLVLMFLPLQLLGDKVGMSSKEDTMIVVMIMVWMAVIAGLLMKFVLV